ncbi:aspartyl/asparaginyl beta-hydroxylase (cupin superfamily) [Oxalobacteraceae bacterium GrIS 2.11]
MNYISIVAVALLSGCSLISGLSNSCVENKTDGSRICTLQDSNQNITTRTIERDNKLFISTCSNGQCSEFKEVGIAPTPMTK